MNNNEWITDRLPTEKDSIAGAVLVSHRDSLSIYFEAWDKVKLGMPWQPLPAPYVKTKRWRVEIATVVDCRDPSKPVAKAPDSYAVSDVTYSHWLPIGFTREAAERICDIYNEVLP